MLFPVTAGQSIRRGKHNWEAWRSSSRSLIWWSISLENKFILISQNNCFYPVSCFDLTHLELIFWRKCFQTSCHNNQAFNGRRNLLDFHSSPSVSMGPSEIDMCADELTGNHFLIFRLGLMASPAYPWFSNSNLYEFAIPMCTLNYISIFYGLKCFIIF